MKNQYSQGDAVDVTTPAGGYVAGTAYQVGAALFGVAALTTAQNAANVLWLVGCYTLPKLSTDAWSVGDILYWDNTNHWLTKTVGSNLKVGVAIIANSASSTLGICRLTPG